MLKDENKQTYTFTVSLNQLLDVSHTFSPLSGWLPDQQQHKQEKPTDWMYQNVAATLKKLFVYRLRNTNKQDQIQSMEPNILVPVITSLSSMSFPHQSFSLPVHITVDASFESFSCFREKLLENKSHAETQQ